MMARSLLLLRDSACAWTSVAPSESQFLCVQLARLSQARARPKPEAALSSLPPPFPMTDNYMLTSPTIKSDSNLHIASQQPHLKRNCMTLQHTTLLVA